MGFIKLRHSLSRGAKNILWLTALVTTLICFNIVQLSLYSLDSVATLQEYQGDLSSISDEDPSFIKYIQRQLLPPAPRHVPLKLYGEVHKGQIGQAQEVVDYFKGKKNGVFVEAGAWNGEYLSNTLYLEVIFKTFSMDL